MFPKTLRKLFFSWKMKCEKIWYNIPGQGSITESPRQDCMALSTRPLQLLTISEMFNNIYIECIWFVVKSSFLVYDVIGSRWWRHRLSLMTSSLVKPIPQWTPPNRKIAEKFSEPQNFARKMLLITTVNFTTVCWLSILKVRFWSYLNLVIVHVEICSGKVRTVADPRPVNAT